VLKVSVRVLLPLTICLAMISSVRVSAQTNGPPPLTSNRPGIGDSEDLVGRAVVQLELGVQSASLRSGDEHEWTTGWGQSTFRFGIVNPVEVFVTWGGFSVDRDSVAGITVVESGSTDVLLGAKFAVLSESRHGLTLTVQPTTSFPIGGEDFSSGSYDGSFRLMWGRSLPRGWDASGNIVFLRTTDENGRYWDNVVTTTVGKSLTESLSAFTELAVGLAEPSAWTVDGGIAWLSRPNVQWDLSVGALVRGPGESWFLSGGVTLRRLPRRMRTAAVAR
jgi:Putative MetA-pathway of phenol degradation